METVHTIGRRKESIARIFLKEGKGNITINKKDHKEYIPVVHLRQNMLLPLTELDVLEKYDISVNVRGGGVKGQAEAIRLAIARALCEVSQENRSPLKKAGFLTRNPKAVERKKYGRKKARKSFQFSKR